MEGAAHATPVRSEACRKKPDTEAMGYEPWRAEPDGALVLDIGRFRLVVKERGGRIRYLVWQRPGDTGAGTYVLLASGTESNVRAAMAAAEKKLAGGVKISS